MREREFCFLLFLAFLLVRIQPLSRINDKFFRYDKLKILSFVPRCFNIDLPISAIFFCVIRIAVDQTVLRVFLLTSLALVDLTTYIVEVLGK